MYTTRSSLYGGVSVVGGSPWQRPPWTETLPGQRPPGQSHSWTETPWKEHGTRDRDPLEGTWEEGIWDQATKQEMASYRGPSHLWTEWLTHACENITLPQILFAGGNYTIGQLSGL